MNRIIIGRAAIVSLALGATSIACTPGADLGHVASVSEAAPRPADAKAAARIAARARAALDRHHAAAAVRLAEQAVAAAPDDADHRLLLGQAYLAAGRFASAEGSFRDTLTLAPDRVSVGLSLALARIALGQGEAARPDLLALRGKVAASDLGLALALAGDREDGIALLVDLVKNGQSDARARQNLALCLALDTRWAEARGMAMQDTPPDRIDDKIAGFARLASATDGATRVAILLGVQPATNDPGPPGRLALAAPSPSAPVALAAAAPAPILPEQRAAAPMPPAAVPVAAVVVATVAPSDLSAVPVASAAPVLLAAAPPPLLRAAAAPIAPRGVMPGTILGSVEHAGYVVQLGAFARAGALNAAWREASRVSPRIATFAAVQGDLARRGDTPLVRLSLGGFAARSDATTICRQIRLRGGACFVRANGGDRPWQWASRTTTVKLAMD